MTTQTVTLTEFLLARIEEDEADLLRLVDPLEFIDDTCVVRWGERVLAECEAKRRIVEHYADLAQAWDTIADALDDGLNEGGDDGEDEDVLPLTLRLLALPYADHPDYRPEWRP